MDNFDNGNADVVGNAKIWAVLSYIGILWIIALLVPEKDTAYVKNHANNGIVLTIAGVICGVIPVIGWIASIAVLVLAILGIVNACQNKMYKLPSFLGNFEILM